MTRRFGLKLDEIGLHSARKFVLSKLANASENPPGDMRIGRLMIADEGTREIMCFPPGWMHPHQIVFNGKMEQSEVFQKTFSSLLGMSCLHDNKYIIIK